MIPNLLDMYIDVSTLFFLVCSVAFTNMMHIMRVVRYDMEMLIVSAI